VSGGAPPGLFPEEAGGRFLDVGVLDALSTEARSRPRRRANGNLHAMEDPVHRLLNAVEPGTYIRPHRHLHPPKDETYLVVRGALGLVLFDASGAVAAVHAGWRGVVADVVGAAVAALRAGAPGEPDLVAAIGPHISAAAFEVGEDVATALGAVAPEVPAVRRSPGGRPCVDLRALVRAELVRAGVPTAAIDDVAGCTFSEPDRFFSFRRDGAHSGRHLAAIVARAG